MNNPFPCGTGTSHLSRTGALTLYLVAGTLFSAACGGSPAGSWTGTVDTLESGIVVVTNPKTGIWKPGDEWTVTLDTQIGRADGEGPDLFGNITDFTVDPQGRFWIFDGQAQELRVFDADGQFVRTIGRKGEGPGEFAQVTGFDWSPRGELWMVDPGNSRIAIYDTAGTLLRNEQAIGGWITLPWPGGFDDKGCFHNNVPVNTGKSFEAVLVKYDEKLEPLDTMIIPRYTGTNKMWEAKSSGGGFMRMSVPYSPGLTGQFIRHTSYYWFALTGEYKLFQRTLDGDTVRIITKEYRPAPVTGADVDEARKNIEWFTRQGGKANMSDLPSHKPALSSFLVDDRGYLWVKPITDKPDSENNDRDIFDPEGRYLGRLTLPFHLSYPRAKIYGDMMYGVITDELEVPYVIRARIDRRES